MSNDPRSYRQPRRINAVSLVLLAVLVCVTYVGVCSWPVINLYAGVKGALDEALPHLYRANLLPEPESTDAAEQTRHALVEKLTGLGVADAETMTDISRDTRTVAIGVRLATAIDLRLVRKRIPLALHPRVQTSAEPVSH